MTFGLEIRVKPRKGDDRGGLRGTLSPRTLMEVAACAKSEKALGGKIQQTEALCATLLSLWFNYIVTHDLSSFNKMSSVMFG